MTSQVKADIVTECAQDNRCSGCTQETKRCKYDKYNSDYITSTCCLQNLRRMLLYFNVLAKKFEMTYFLDFGTLLGCARNGKFIPYDTDIDISILFSEFYLFRQMKPSKMGFYLLKQNESKTFYKLYYSKNNFLHIDIHLRKKSKDGVYYSHYGSENWGLLEEDLFPISYKKFEARLLPVPNNYKGYLTKGYGEDCITVPKRKGEYTQKY